MPLSQLSDPSDRVTWDWKVKKGPRPAQYLFFRLRAWDMRRMREAGSTYRKIAEHFGVSAGRCRQIIEHYQGKFEPPKPRPPQPCRLCGAPHGEPHLRLGPYPPRGRSVSVHDMGNGIWLP